jgi:O-antigen/teichoic acid export membrane protein
MTIVTKTSTPGNSVSSELAVGILPPGQANSEEIHFRTDHLLKNLGRRAFSGGLITTIAQGARFALFMALNIVLARMLAPPDFGLVAMALALTSILYMFREAGLSTATVQQQTITHAQVSNLFWINVVIGVCCAGVAVIAAPVMAWFYRDERIILVTVWLSLTLLAGGAAVQHLALLNRQMRFKALAVIDVGSMAASLLVGIAMAALGCGYWSLVGAQLAAAGSELLMAWIASRWRPQWVKRGVGTRSMLNFGASLTFAMLVRRITTNADSFLLGRYFGAHALGVYSRAMALVMRPLDQFLVPFDKVFLPVLSRLQDEPDRYRRYFLQIYSLIALASFPVAGLLLGLSRPIVLVLLGPRWIEAAPVLACLALVALYYPVAGASMWLLTTQRRNRDILASGIAISAITLVSFVAGLRFGAVGVALSFSAFGLLVRLPVQYFIVGRVGPVRAFDLWVGFFKHLPMCFVVGLGAYLPQYVVPNAGAVAHSLTGCVAGLLAGFGVVFAVPAYRRQLANVSQVFGRTVLKSSAAVSGPAVHGQAL